MKKTIALFFLLFSSEVFGQTATPTCDYCSTCFNQQTPCSTPIGTTTPGTSVLSDTVNTYFAQQPAITPGQFNRINVYANAGGTSVIAGIYDGSSGPTTLIVNSQILPVTAGWNPIPIPPTNLSGTKWIGAMFKNGQVNYDSGGTYAQKSNFFPFMLSDITGAATNSNHISWYLSECPSSAQSPPANRYMAVGDSITNGQNATGNLGFSYLVYNWLNYHAYSTAVTIAGVGGQTSAGLASNIAGYLASFPNPNYCTIEIGLNDVRAIIGVDLATGKTSSQTYKTNLQAVVTAVLASGCPASHIVIPNLYDKTFGYGSSYAGEFNGWTAYEGILTEFVTRQLEVVRANRLLLSDWYTQFNNPIYLDVDGLHPNDAGHALLGGLVEGSLGCAVTSNMAPFTFGF